MIVSSGTLSANGLSNISADMPYLINKHTVSPLHDNDATFDLLWVVNHTACLIRLCYHQGTNHLQVNLQRQDQYYENERSNVFVFTVFTQLSAQCGQRLGKFSVEGMMTIIRFTAPLNDCRSQRISRYCTFALLLFSLLRRLQHARRSLLGQQCDHEQ